MWAAFKAAGRNGVIVPKRRALFDSLRPRPDLQKAQKMIRVSYHGQYIPNEQWGTSVRVQRQDGQCSTKVGTLPASNRITPWPTQPSASANKKAI